MSLALIALQAQAMQLLSFITRTTSKTEKDPRPMLKKGQSEDKYLHFKKQWVRYRMESNLVVEQIRDQLLAYAAGRT